MQALHNPDCKRSHLRCKWCGNYRSANMECLGDERNHEHQCHTPATEHFPERWCVMNPTLGR